MTVSEGSDPPRDRASSVDAVLFDLDDTLCRYRRPGSEVLREAFAKAGVRPFFTTDEYVSRYRTYLEESTDIETLRKTCFGDIATEKGLDRDVGIAVARAYASVRDQRNVEPLPGADRAVSTLADSYRLGLVTNGGPSMQRRKLDALGLDDTFDVTVFAGYDTAAKPDPEPFLVALEELGTTPDRAVYVGNSLSSDVAGARAAGLRSVWIPDEDHPVESPDPIPEYRVHSLEELRQPPWLLDRSR